MSTTKHTPKRWELDMSGKHIQVYSDIGTLIVDRIARRERETENDEGKFSNREIANARLIAAAPELLEALKEAAGFVDSELYPELKAKIEAAIKKAEQS